VVNADVLAMGSSCQGFPCESFVNKAELPSIVTGVARSSGVVVESAPMRSCKLARWRERHAKPVSPGPHQA